MGVKFNPFVGNFDLTGSGGSPDGVEGAIQYNDGGSFAGLDTFRVESPESVRLGVSNGSFQFAGTDGASNESGAPIAFFGGVGEGEGNGGGLTFTSGNGGEASGSGGAFTMSAGSATGGDGTGGSVQISAGAGRGEGNGGGFGLYAGSGDGSTGIGNGGAIEITAGNSADNGGVGGSISIAAGRGDDAGGDVTIVAGQGSAGNADGGDIILGPNMGSGAGARGQVKFLNPSSGSTTAFETQIVTGSKTLSIFNQSGYLVVAPGHGRATAQTAANTNVLTVAVGAAEATFILLANVLVTTSTTHSITVTVDYTDESNTARTLTMPFSQLAGTILTAITNVTGAGPYSGVNTTIRAKGGTNIVFKTAGTFTTVTYNVDATVVMPDQLIIN